MTDWAAFTGVTGPSAAALVGLLFVAVTLRIDAISQAHDLRNRAAETLVLFVTALVVSIVLSVPNQLPDVLGGELLVIAVTGGVTLLVLNDRALKSAQSQPVARLVDRISPNGITMVLVAAAGALLLAGVGWGLYLVAPAIIAALVGGVIGAWLFLTQIPAKND